MAKFAGSCGTCKFSHSNGPGEMHCRHEPPKPIMVGVREPTKKMVQMPNAMNIEPVVISYFPPVDPIHTYCWQYLYDPSKELNKPDALLIGDA